MSSRPHAIYEPSTHSIWSRPRIPGSLKSGQTIGTCLPPHLISDSSAVPSDKLAPKWPRFDDLSRVPPHERRSPDRALSAKTKNWFLAWLPTKPGIKRPLRGASY